MQTMERAALKSQHSHPALPVSSDPGSSHGQAPLGRLARPQNNHPASLLWTSALMTHLEQDKLSWKFKTERRTGWEHRHMPNAAHTCCFENLTWRDDCQEPSWDTASGRAEAPAACPVGAWQPRARHGSSGQVLSTELIPTKTLGRRS